MVQTKKQFWSNCLIFAAVTLVACGKKEVISEPAAAAIPPPVIESRSVNPESHGQGVGVSDRAAYATVDSPAVLGVNLADHVPEGVLITSIVTDSQASKLDLQPNDVILRLGDTPTPTAQEFERVYKSIDSKITVEVALLRNGNMQNVALRKQ